MVPPDDFFDGEWEEPSRTQETAPTRPAGDQPGPSERPPRPGRDRSRGGRMPRRPSMPRMSGMPALEGLEWGRLGMLAAGIVVVVLVLVLLTKQCSGSSAQSKNSDYMSPVQAGLKTSDGPGTSPSQLLQSPAPFK